MLRLMKGIKQLTRSGSKLKQSLSTDFIFKMYLEVPSISSCMSLVILYTVHMQQLFIFVFKLMKMSRLHCLLSRLW